MKRELLLLVTLMLLTNVTARPGGIDNLGNNGCACHGGSDEEVTIEVTGLPSEYNSGISYNVTILISSPVQSFTDVEGGMRILFNHGEVTTNDLQLIDDGWTQLNSTNDRRIWNLTWNAPEEDDLLVEIIVHGNTVNGDNTTDGDMWSSIGISIPGPSYTGEVTDIDVNHELDTMEVIAGAMALTLLFILAYFAVRD
ncbi:MAG: hypothetical protein QGI21_07300 [Candidatus Poseidoniaceae archaeon]|jgi:hypothetical protein|nr:hypothetical protein [Candidatus Poseidoniaceae archaeon]